jgi:pimeloyl-ACP methyl ester carboxylesterase
MNEIDGIEHNALGMSRRLLLGAGLLGATIVAGGAATAADAGGGFSAVHRGANDPLPPAAVSANQSMFPGFRQTFVQTRGVMVDGKLAEGAVINTLIGGKGPPLLLIHGHPETHVCWHKVAGKLAERFTVVLTDLRGYGDSSKPDGGEEHVNYAKRAMAVDQVQVMQSLGFDRFQTVGHDRGGRVLQFMMLDHPEALERGVVLDIAPTDLMYAQTDKSFATKYFWWFFQIQDAPLPERFIGALPDYYLESHCDPEQDSGCRYAGSSRCLYPDLQRAGRDPCGVRGLPRSSRDRHSSSHGGSDGWPEDDSAAARGLGRERHGRAGFRCGGALEAGGCDGIGTSTSVRTPDPGGGSRRPPCLARRVSNPLIRRAAI